MGQPPEYPGQQQPGQPPQPPAPPGPPGPPSYGPGSPDAPGPGGMPPAAPPPSGRSSKGRTIGIIAAAVVLIAAGVGGAIALTGGDDDGGSSETAADSGGTGGDTGKDGQNGTVGKKDGNDDADGNNGGDTVPDDGKTYKLATPKTVLTEYYLTPPDEDSDDSDDVNVADLTKAGMRDGTPVNAGYSNINPDSDAGSSGLEGLKALSFQGGYGKVADPEKTVDAMFVALRAEAKKDSADDLFVGSPQRQSPPGSEGAVIKCQSIKVEDPDPGDPTSAPVCAWADHSTAAVVIAFGTTPETMPSSTGELAKTTTELRQEIRVEVG